MRKHLLIVTLIATSLVEAAPRKKKSQSPPRPRAATQTPYEVLPPPPPQDYGSGPADVDHSWTDLHSPWDFSALISIYNPGLGFGVLGARRVLNNVLPRFNDTLSIETGLSYISVSDTIDGISVNYNAYEIPAFARWDFHIRQLKLSPRGGLVYLSGGKVNAQGRDLTTRGGTLYVQVGPSVFYQIKNDFYFRFNALFGGYTHFSLGATYFLP